jgi:hypothetical protein
MTYDYKQLCAELHAALEKHDLSLAEDRLLDRSAAALRAALAEPEPKGPTDEALDELFTEIDQSGEPESWRVYARAVLARWGNHPGSPDSSIPQPAAGEVARVAKWLHKRGRLADLGTRDWYFLRRRVAGTTKPSAADTGYREPAGAGGL